MVVAWLPREGVPFGSGPIYPSTANPTTEHLAEF